MMGRGIGLGGRRVLFLFCFLHSMDANTMVEIKQMNNT